MTVEHPTATPQILEAYNAQLRATGQRLAEVELGIVPLFRLRDVEVISMPGEAVSIPDINTMYEAALEVQGDSRKPVEIRRAVVRGIGAVAALQGDARSVEVAADYLRIPGSSWLDRRAAQSISARKDAKRVISYEQKALRGQEKAEKRSHG